MEENLTKEDIEEIKSKNWTYETKCRRCGHLTEWAGYNKNNFTQNQFLQAISEMLLSPPFFYCRGECNKHTIQDLVSYY